MAGKEPLLGTLKACVLGLRAAGSDIITDDYAHVTPLCEILEMILRKGLKSGVLGLKRRDYWHWIEELPQHDTCGSRRSRVAVMIEKTTACPKLLTAQGRGRYFLRLALNRKSLATPIQYLKHTQRLLEWYDPLLSVLGNEEYFEPFLSLLLVMSESSFSLDLENSSFLDDSWILPVYSMYQTVPCRELGMVLRNVPQSLESIVLYVSKASKRPLLVNVPHKDLTYSALKRYHEGRVFVVEVLPGSQAEVDEVVLAGDVIDEINGVSLRNASNGQAGTVLSKLKGEPLVFRMIRWRWKNGEVFRPLIPYIKDIQERIPTFQLQQKPRTLESDEERPEQDGRLMYALQYLGQADIGMFGGKEVLDAGITKVQKQNISPKEVLLDIKETEIVVKEMGSSEVLFQYPYPEISSVGRRLDNKRVFALCVVHRDESSDISFNCLVFEAHLPRESEEIIKRVATGFKHTEWFV